MAVVDVGKECLRLETDVPKGDCGTERRKLGRLASPVSFNRSRAIRMFAWRYSSDSKWTRAMLQKYPKSPEQFAELLKDLTQRGRRRAIALCQVVDSTIEKMKPIR
jgi:hypothetical protein